MFKLHRKRESNFKTTAVSLGSHRLGYVRPTPSQLRELTKPGTISATPFGTIPKRKSTITKILDRLETDPNQKQVKYMDFDIGDLVKFDQPKDNDSISRMARFK